jgi:hypothetical protein
LLVQAARTAVEGATVAGWFQGTVGGGAWGDEGEGVEVPVDAGGEEDLGGTVVGAVLGEEDGTVAEDYFCVDGAFARGTEATGRGEIDVVCRASGGGTRGAVGHGASPMGRRVSRGACQRTRHGVGPRAELQLSRIAPVRQTGEDDSVGGS